jgi:diadenosine tetraphosphate (Ap4A) HIT family hydrolase
MVGNPECVHVWEDGLWRLEMSMSTSSPGFSLQPKRRIPSITDLDGDEAVMFGAVLAHLSRTLKEELGAEFVTISVADGDASHLYVRLIPHGDTADKEQHKVAERVRRRLAEDPLPRPHREEPPPLIPFPLPQPQRRPGEEPEPEIPPPRRLPPDEEWPDRPAHDPWF